MKLFKTTAYAFAAAVAMCAFSACGGDDDDNGGITPPAPIPSPNPVEGVLPAEDAKEYVEDTVIDFMGLFDARDQEAIVNLADFVAENYGDLDFPDLGDSEDFALSPKNFTQALAAAVRTHTFNPLSRASYVYDIKFSDFTGVYEPGRYAWEKTSNSNDIVFRFRGPSGNCELKVIASGNSTVIEDYDDEYDETIRVHIPRNVNITLTEGSTVHANIAVVNELNISGHSYFANVNGTVANLGVKVESRGSDSQLSESQALSVNGRTILTSTATIHGRNMLNPDYIDNLDEEEYTSLFTNGSASANIMGNIEVRAQVKSVANIAKVSEDTYFDEWDEYSQSEALNLCRRACETINSNIVADVYFGGNNSVQASVIFQPELDDDYYYWYVEAVPVIKYAADGSTQSFDDALDGFNLGKIERQWEALVNSYRRLFR